MTLSGKTSGIKKGGGSVAWLESVAQTRTNVQLSCLLAVWMIALSRTSAPGE
jgi:hypothetical protein